MIVLVSITATNHDSVILKLISIHLFLSYLASALCCSLSSLSRVGHTLFGRRFPCSNVLPLSLACFIRMHVPSFTLILSPASVFSFSLSSLLEKNEENGKTSAPA